MDRLREGNRRFVSDVRGQGSSTGQTRRNELVAGQQPFAIILGCSDSRVPAEIVFDEGLGELFVIRVAGNIVAPSQIGSVEFAACLYDTPLVVVMGHSMCGAVMTTLESWSARPETDRQPAVDRESDPAVCGGAVGDGSACGPGGLLRQAIRANVRASVAQLRHGSEVLEDLIEQGRLLVVGAEYSLETGVVDFFLWTSRKSIVRASHAICG